MDDRTKLSGQEARSGVPWRRVAACVSTHRYGATMDDRTNMHSRTRRRAARMTLSTHGPTMTSLIFVTGGVVSSLGKGIASASLASILEARGLNVTVMKLDPYINVDPGTMSPFQHGEVYVTDDGAETDLDLGHYER